MVDNGSTDGTAALVRDHAARNPRVRLVDATERRGPSYTRNVGFEAAAAELIAACDADDVIAPGWVRAMGDALRVHPCVTGPLEVDRLNPAWLATTPRPAEPHRGPDLVRRLPDRGRRQPGHPPGRLAGGRPLRRGLLRPGGPRVRAPAEPGRRAGRVRARGGRALPVPRAPPRRSGSRARSTASRGRCSGAGSRKPASRRRRASPAGDRGPGCSCTSSTCAPSTAGPCGCGSRPTASGSCAAASATGRCSCEVLLVLAVPPARGAGAGGGSRRPRRPPRRAHHAAADRSDRLARPALGSATDVARGRRPLRRHRAWVASRAHVRDAGRGDRRRGGRRSLRRRSRGVPEPVHRSVRPGVARRARCRSCPRSTTSCRTTLGCPTRSSAACWRPSTATPGRCSCTTRPSASAWWRSSTWTRTGSASSRSRSR